MESADFFDDLRARFLALAENERDLHAIHDDSNLAEHAARGGTFVAFAFQNPDVPLDDVKSAARRAFHVAAIVHEHGPINDAWVMSGGPSDRNEREILHQRFTNWVVRGVIGANETAGSVATDDALHAWFSLLVRNSSPYFNSLKISQLCRASALMCELLATRAFRMARESDGTALAQTADRPVETVHSDPTTENDEARALRRRSVIAPILKRRHLNRNRWATRAGVNRSVVYDYMSGKSNPQPVNADAMAKAIELESLPE